MAASSLGHLPIATAICTSMMALFSRPYPLPPGAPKDTAPRIWRSAAFQNPCCTWALMASAQTLPLGHHLGIGWVVPLYELYVPTLMILSQVEQLKTAHIYSLKISVGQESGSA